MENFMEKLKMGAQKLCSIFEFLVGVLVCIAILFAIVALIPQLGRFIVEREAADSFLFFIERCFTVIIGVEFLQMLFKPNSDNVLEILIFLVARHMIIGKASAVETFVSVVSITLLCVIRRYLHDAKIKGSLFSDKETEKKERGDRNG